MKKYSPVKNALETITIAFSMLLVLSFTVKSQNASQLGAAAIKATEEKRFDDALRITDQGIAAFPDPNVKLIFYKVQGLAILSSYAAGGFQTEVAKLQLRKLDLKMVERMRHGIKGQTAALDYLQKNPALKEASEMKQAADNTGLMYLALADGSTRAVEDYAAAEKYLRLGLRKNQMFSEGGLIRALAGQGKFSDARKETLRLLDSYGAESSAYNNIFRFAVHSFDFVGEPLMAQALILEVGGKMKSAGKAPDLSVLKYIYEQHTDGLAAALAIENPADRLELNSKGAALYYTGKRGEALPLLEKAALIGYNPTALRWLGKIYLAQDEPQKLEMVAVKLIAGDAMDVGGLTLRGIIAGMKNSPAQAEKDFSQAIAIYPELAYFNNSHKALAIAYRDQAKTAEAQALTTKKESLDQFWKQIQKGL